MVIPFESQITPRESPTFATISAFLYIIATKAVVPSIKTKELIQLSKLTNI